MRQSQNLVDYLHDIRPSSVEENLEKKLYEGRLQVLLCLKIQWIFIQFDFMYWQLSKGTSWFLKEFPPQDYAVDTATLKVEHVFESLKAESQEQTLIVIGISYHCAFLRTFQNHTSTLCDISWSLQPCIFKFQDRTQLWRTMVKYMRSQWTLRMPWGWTSTELV